MVKKIEEGMPPLYKDMVGGIGLSRSLRVLFS